ncbi:MAG: cold shock domain-containing protein [Sedimentisphaerales bacterium]|nr:cold shock domain-containing protein [Sedimentisphaerales bacterium]
MAEGTVKWYNNRKGFGFISNNKSGQDVFVHYTQIMDEQAQSLLEGDTVEYEEIPGEIGPRAAKVIKKRSTHPDKDV